MCVGDGGPDNTLEWRRNGVVISNNNILVLTMITGSDGGMYQCIVTNGAGSENETSTLTGGHYS